MVASALLMEMTMQDLSGFPPAAYPDHYMKPHLAVERGIVDALIREAIARGMLIRVYDGEEWAHDVPTADYAEITREIAATDMTTLRLFWPVAARPAGDILLVHGNGEDVVSDYTANADTSGLVLWTELKRMLSERFPWLPLSTLSDMIARAVEHGEDDLATELRFWGERWDEEVAGRVAYDRAYERQLRETWVRMSSDAGDEADVMLPLADFIEANPDELSGTDIDRLLSGRKLKVGFFGAAPDYSLRVEIGYQDCGVGVELPDGEVM